MQLKNFIYGLIIGIGFIIPGVSGGVLATILGIYETILYRLNNLFKNFKDNILYLIPIILGVFISVLIFSKLILYFLDNNYNFISYIFIGLIIGCIPFLIQEIHSKTNKKISVISFLIAFIFGLILFIIEKNNFISNGSPSLTLMILAGLIYSVGKIVPGISGAALLMLIGVYEFLLEILANPFIIDLNTIILLIPFFISFIISSIFIIKIMNYLLNNYFSYTYSAIIGFILSSILFIYPGYFSILSLIITICSFIISYFLSN